MNIVEIWKDIIEYEGLYKVSNLGRVQRNNKILKNKRCTSGEYLNVCLSKNNKQKYSMIHRLVAIHFISMPIDTNIKYEVNHIDGNKKNNIVTNLEWVTRSENLAHAEKLGLMNHKGPERDKCHLTKLSTEKVKEFIKYKKQGFKMKELAIIFNMSVSGLEKVASKYISNDLL